MTSHRERLQACLAGEIPDRAPVALWRHFPVDDQRPDRLAAASLAFQRAFDWDLVKVTPSSSFSVGDWGAKDEWKGAAEGTREYTYRAIQRPEDWYELPVLDPLGGHLGDQLSCLRQIYQQLGPDTPVIQTIFSPLSQAKNLVGGANLVVHLRRYPEAVHAGLKTIAETTRKYVAAVRETGAAGVFYAVQLAQFGLLSTSEFQAFGRAYDLSVLEEASSLWLNMLHLHGTEVMFDEVSDYPVQIINWHDRDTFPSLREGKARFSGVVCGGIQREATMVLSTPEKILAEARDAIEQTGGQRFMLGTGCVVPITAPYGNLMAVRDSVEAVR